MRLKTIAALGALALALLAHGVAGAAGALAQVNIANVPLLNIDGTGAAKPNLMLLFDNSGSMDQAYTPDYVNDALCRSRALLMGSAVGCIVGHPPFMSPDFNKQYYNPQISYTPPLKSDGVTRYPSMTADNTHAVATDSGWTSVTNDGFGARKLDMFGNSVSTTNLASGFPDLSWCDSSGGNCKNNTATYTYPDDTNWYPKRVTGAPYYYTIGVGEYCTDANMTTCKATSVGASAPDGYPVPVKVRWCSTSALSVCQGKRVGAFIYPRYSTPLGWIASYGTIAIGQSNTAASLTISAVTIPDPTTARSIVTGVVTASTGTNTALKQQTVASALAASIIAKSNTNQYWACVNTPIGQTSVAACSTYGITLGGDNVVAVMPVVCGGTKSAANCRLLGDASRAGWGITATSPSVQVVAAVAAAAAVKPTAFITVSGTSSSTKAQTLPSIKLGTSSTNLIGTLPAFGTKTSAASVASRIVAQIGSAGTVQAYLGGNGITPACASKSSTTVCLVDTAATSNGAAVTMSALTPSGGTLAFATSAASGYVAAVTAVSAVYDTIPLSTVALAAGATPPSTFVRTDIVPGNDSYPKYPARVADCKTAGRGDCTYIEEMTNFANWYAYYKTRIQMMKSSIGAAFAPLTSSYRVGYVKLSTAAVGGTIEIVPADFAAAARAAWYTSLYNTTAGGSTPIRTAMDYVGKMFANQTPYNYASGSEVVQYPCQQNFEILTTDGYWNGGAPAGSFTSPATGPVNNDNVEDLARFCTKDRGCVDARTQDQPSISDVALYWYNGGSNDSTVSLRPTLEPDMTKPGLVSAGPGENSHLHVTMFTLGLGVDGVMNYEPNYDTTPIAGGDFANLKNAVTSGCSWNGGQAYVWPNPDVDNTNGTVQERVDDLWHAAVNGHGKYFSATAPTQVVAGLSEAIAQLDAKVGAAAAAATSTPNISQEDRDIFSDTFTTVKWYGELTDNLINATSGMVEPTVLWSTSTKLGTQVAASTDTRNILWLDASTSTPVLKQFKYDQLGDTEKAWFDTQCAVLAQCNLLSADNQAIANGGANMVDWLRGQQQYANNIIYRAYTPQTMPAGGAVASIPIVLGDIASAKPAYLYDARKAYAFGGYDQFKTDSLARQRTLFAAANDGMLHAFYAPDGSAAAPPDDKAGGKEIWAYVPRITMKKLPVQASTNYSHQYTVDGSPELADVQIGGVWKTVLVAGLNDGGRGYYAIDVTVPDQPKPLWEMCADANVCANHPQNLGLSYGNPQFGTHKGRWVVYLTSGYNNVPGGGGDTQQVGDGNGYLYTVDVATGEILYKTQISGDSSGTALGLAKITAISANPAADPETTYIYAGDNQGGMWRFDMTTETPTVLKMGDAGTGQPITTRPDVTSCLVNTSNADGTVTSSAQRVVAFGTGRLLDVSDITDNTTQSVYVVKDDGTTISPLRGTNSALVAQSLARVGTSGTYTVGGGTVDLSLKSGWYADFDQNAGERINIDPKIVSGGLNIVTNVPSASSACTVGGTSNVYQFDVCTGKAVAALAGTTLSGNAAAVGYIIIRLPSGAYMMISTLSDGTKLTLGLPVPNTVGAHLTGWRRVRN